MVRLSATAAPMRRRSARNRGLVPGLRLVLHTMTYTAAEVPSYFQVGTCWDASST